MRAKWISGLFLLSALAACTGGGGGGGTGFDLLTVNVSNGGHIPINQPLEMTFNEPVDINTVNLGSTVNIYGVSTTPTISSVPPVTGTFYIKSGSEGKTLVFQANCPSNSTNNNGGLIPGNAFGDVNYTVSILDSTGSGPVIRNTEGNKLQSGITFTFATLNTSNPFSDPVPPPPSVTNLSEIPSEIGLNLLTAAIAPIEIAVDQPVKAASVTDSWYYLKYENPSSPGTFITVPSDLSVSENCNSTGGARFVLTVRGILPESTSLLLVQGLVEGYGNFDIPLESTVIKTITVAAAATPQKDAIIETFDDNAEQDTSTALVYPAAAWSSGLLQASAPFPGIDTDKDIIIGFGTFNGHDVTIDTTLSTLKAIDGSTVTITDGVIYCRDFTLKEDASGKNGKLTGIGPNALRIVASGNVIFEKNTSVFVEGTDTPGIVTVQTGNVIEPGAPGRCTGGDGGASSPVASGSSPTGEDGKGAFNVTGGGGRAGKAGYGSATGVYSIPNGAQKCTGGAIALPDQCPVLQVKGAGAGGGSFATMEYDGAADGPFCYGKITGFFTTLCNVGGAVTNTCGVTMTAAADVYDPNAAPNPDLCGADPNINMTLLSTFQQQTPCSGSQPSTNTLGEAGANSPTNSSAADAQNFGTEVLTTTKDASTGQVGPKGGAAGPVPFVDDSDSNDFFGTKILDGGNVVLGELVVPHGGAGGGGGGDAIASTIFPPAPTYNTANDFKGCPGGGGGGLFWVQALGRITANGLISARGGDSANGELIFCNYPVGGGGGGGSGGMILLESLTGVTIGATTSDIPQLRARGGDRGYGVSLKATVTIGATTFNEKCHMNLACVSGLPSGYVWGNYCCTSQNGNGGTPTTGVEGLPGKSRRSTAKSRGGAGGAGLILIGVPLNEATGALQTGALKAIKLNPASNFVQVGDSGNAFDMSTQSCGTNYCYSSALGILRFQNPITTANYTSKPNINPNAHITQPSFGLKSQALSAWRYIGAATADFTFGGTTSGDVDLNIAEITVASASSGVTIESPNELKIENSTLYDYVSSNAKILIGNHFQAESAGSRYSIVNAELVSGSSNEVRIFTSPSDGDIETTGTWSVINRYYDVITDGTLNTLPSATSVKIEFQGAAETSLGSGEPGTTTSFTNSINDLDGNKFIRYRVTFNMLTSGSIDSNIIDKERPALSLLRIPFEF